MHESGPRESAPRASVAQLRSEVRRRRGAIDPAERAHRSNAAMARVEQLPVWSTVGRLAVYRPFDGELDPAALTAAAAARGVEAFVPVVGEDRLRFARFDATTTWAPNRYGIGEPVGTEVAEADTLDLVLVPAVAVDPAGHRIGMGAGWYDRTFAWLLDASRPADVVLVSTVHDEQVVDAITPEPWDVPVDAIVTPTRTVLVGGVIGG